MVEITIKRPTKFEVAYLRAECEVRYWDDASVNGVTDDADRPSIPFAVNDTWCPVISLDTGVIVDWPQGTTASVHYKVCDAGRYSLLDPLKSTVLTIDGYVPRIMSPKANGYGDYVIMDIGADGAIANWRVDLEAFLKSGDEE